MIFVKGSYHEEKKRIGVILRKISEKKTSSEETLTKMLRDHKYSVRM